MNPVPPLGDQHRANKKIIEEAEAEGKALNQARRDLEKNKAELMQYQNEITKIDTSLQDIRKAEQNWQKEGAINLAKADQSLKADDFLPDVRLKIAARKSGWLNWAMMPVLINSSGRKKKLLAPRWIAATSFKQLKARWWNCRLV